MKTACVKGLLCCGMPAWETGDLDSVRKQAAHNLKLLKHFVDAGAKVVAINPTCAMMMRREYPELLPETLRPEARRLAELVRDPSELLWEIREEPRINTDFKSTPGGPVAYHAPCHLRAQGIGFKGRDLLRKIPDTTIAATVIECSGHDGTYAMKLEGFEPSQRVGRKAFEQMKATEADHTLHLVGSTFSPENESVYDGISRPGRRVVTFAPVLKHRVFPLAEILDFILEMGTWGMGTPCWRAARRRSRCTTCATTAAASASLAPR